MPAYPLEIIIPVYNERENIDQVLNQFKNYNLELKLCTDPKEIFSLLKK